MNKKLKLTTAQRNKNENNRLKRLYGITLEWYKEQLQKQNGVCWICKRPPKKLKLAVDHSHLTGKARSLLCMICNRKIIGCIERFRIPVHNILAYLQTFDTNNRVINPAINSALEGIEGISVKIKAKKPKAKKAKRK